MEITEKRDMYLDYLSEGGYHPEVDADGDVRFRYEGGHYYLSVSDDGPFFRLVYPNFWSIENDDERGRAVEAANFATADTKVAKVFVRADGKDTVASIEMFLDPLADFKSVFPRSLTALQVAVQTFASRMKGDA